MEYRQLGRSDLKVSAIGLGAVTFSREIDEATAFTIIDHALDRGINLIDTAEAYNKGGSETVVGNWIKTSGKRDKIVLATKLIPPLTAARVPEAVEASLRRLQTDVIDLYQIHAFDKNTPMDESLEALGKLVTQGKVRYLGCSNFAKRSGAPMYMAGRASNRCNPTTTSPFAISKRSCSPSAPTSRSG